MLKFIRKYQLPILVVGGSLLMVVFLLQPVLTRLSPSPAKAKIATIGDNKKVTAGDRQTADFELNVIKRVSPRSVLPASQGGLGLTQIESDRPLHWFLLSKEATDAGLVGDAADGRAWVEEIAQTEAYIVVSQKLNQRVYTQQGEAEQDLADLSSRYSAQLHRNAASSAGAMPGYTEEDVYRTLAKARGVYRLLRLYNTVPAYSDLSANRAVHDNFDSVAVSAAVLNASILADTIADPTEEELDAFFDEYKDKFPQDTEFSVGYQQPTRIRLAYLMMDRNTLHAAVPISRVEIIKIHKQNRDLYPGDLPSERAKIERKYRDDTANDMMIESDRIIRAQILNATRGLAKDEGVYQLPEDWDARRPKLEDIAQAVVEGIRQQFDAQIPTPTIVIQGSSWLDATAIQALPGFGAAQYRIGARQLPTFAIPAILETEENIGMNVQPGIPLAAPPATDALENRYYAMVLETNDAGPADSVDDAGRDRVLNDYKSIRGYELLIDHLDEIQTAIANTGDVNSGVDETFTLTATPPSKPMIQENILVSKNTIERGQRAIFVDPALNTEDFRDAVLAAADALDPLVDPNEIPPAIRAVTVALPESKSIALASIVAPRPMTTEQFRSRMRQVLDSQTAVELMEANVDREYPFSFDALSERFNLVMTKKRNKDDADTIESAETPEPEA